MFQSTLPHGERHFWIPIVSAYLVVSIHAPAWGATPNLDLFSYSLAGFNPRSRMGSDVVIHQLFCMFWVSIHAPAWGATIAGLFEFKRAIVSIHAPAWGATIYSVFCIDIMYVSIHAPAWGATTY